MEVYEVEVVFKFSKIYGAPHSNKDMFVVATTATGSHPQECALQTHLSGQIFLLYGISHPFRDA